MGKRREGIRLVQYPNIIGFWILWIWQIVANLNYTNDLRSEEYLVVPMMGGRKLVMSLFIISTIWSLFLRWKFGEANFKHLNHTGPYGVGVKVFWTKDCQNHTLVYYPISYYQWFLGLENPADYFMSWNYFGRRGQIERRLNMKWFYNMNAENPARNIQKRDARTDPFFNGLKIEAVNNAVFDMNAAALNHDEMKLSPIIFSHGLCNNSAVYSRHNMELASHGYIVFAPNHNDGTCSYTEK